MEKSSTQMPAAVVGLDLGDRYSQACFIDPATGAEIRQVRLRTTPRDLERVVPSTGPPRPKRDGSAQTGRIPACTEPQSGLNRVRMEAWLRTRVEMERRSRSPVDLDWPSHGSC
jgi:hypothetical protein